MTTPDPTSLGMGRGIANPANSPVADALGATHPSAGLPGADPKPMAVPGLSIGFSASPTHSTVVKLPFVELPLVGFLLAVIAGILNAFTMIYAGVFATVQAGNVALSAVFLADLHWAQLQAPALSLAAFGLGTFLSSIALSLFHNRRSAWTTTVLLVLGAINAALALLVIAGSTEFMWIAVGVSFAAGVMGNAYRKDNNMLFGALAITFLLQMTFSFLSRALFRRKGLGDVPNLKWAGVFFSVVIGFVIGVAGGAWLIALLGTDPTGFTLGGAANVSASGGWVLMIAAALFWVLAAFSKRTSDEGDPL